MPPFETKSSDSHRYCALLRNTGSVAGEIFTLWNAGNKCAGSCRQLDQRAWRQFYPQSRTLKSAVRRTNHWPLELRSINISCRRHVSRWQSVAFSKRGVVMQSGGEDSCRVQRHHHRV